MSEQVAERLAQRQAIAAGLAQDEKLVGLLGDSVEATADNLEAEYTVPELKAKAEELGVDLAGASLKREIAEAIASDLIVSGEDAEESEPEAEADTAEALEPAEPQEPAPAPQASNGHAAALDDIRPIAGGGTYVQLRHMVRTLVRRGRGDGQNLMDPDQLNDHAYKSYFSKGFDLLFVEHLGMNPDGHMMLLAFGLPNDPEAEPKYHEIYPIVRTISAVGSDGSIAGFRADEYVSSFLADGWEVFKVKQLGLEPSGVNLLWILVR